LSCPAGLILLLALWVLSAPAGAALAEEFQAELDALRQRFGFPGATAGYVLRDGTPGLAATGFADPETGEAMSVSSRMLAASIGKTFVSATLLALANDGLLDLDDRLSNWLADRPWFTRLPNHASLTLRQLLNHTSGLPDHVHMPRFAREFAAKWPERGNPFPPEALIAFVLDQPPLFAPGQGWAYSDTGYILLGLVIEQAAGRDYYAEIRRRFLGPLALSLTDPADRRDLPGLVAGFVSPGNAFGLPRKTLDPAGELVFHPGLEWTGGGLVSNSGDLARWGSALFGGAAMPGVYLHELLRPVETSDVSPDVQYGAGVAIHRRGPFGPVYGHGGWIPGYSSSLRYYPEHGVTIAFQLNTDIGLRVDSQPVIPAMEASLAAVVIGAGSQAPRIGDTKPGFAGTLPNQ
jgi:D-alanyl-D-alanine carboxypeptidase